MAEGGVRLASCCNENDGGEWAATYLSHRSNSNIRELARPTDTRCFQ